jgi:RNA polymerase sigma-70 factor (ECF subfamily)
MRSKTEQNERDTILRAAGGDRSAYDELVAVHYRAIFGHALRMLGNADDAADAAQVTFMKAHRSLGEFDVSRPIRPWLNRICANICTDIVRSKHRGHEPLDQHDYMLVSGDLPDELAERTDLQRVVRRAIAKLPDRYRSIIVMRHYEQLDVEEIAEKVGAPEGTIKSWLFRARALLKRELTPALGTDLASAAA